MQFLVGEALPPAVLGLVRNSRRCFLTVNSDPWPRTWPMVAWFDDEAAAFTVLMTTYARSAKVARLRAARRANVLLSRDERLAPDVAYASLAGDVVVRQLGVKDIDLLERLREQQPDPRAATTSAHSRARWRQRISDGGRLLIRVAGPELAVHGVPPE